MANFVNKYNDMTAYNADSTKQYPNTSKVVSEGKVLFQRENPNKGVIIAKYNVTSTSNETYLLGHKISEYNPVDYFSSMEIDGVVQPNVVRSYTFSTTGEHVIKFKLIDRTMIDQYCFYNITALTSVTIPDTVLTIRGGAFYHCISLTNLIIPNEIEYIDGFEGCTSLTSVAIPDSVVNLGTSAFQSCSGLTTVTIGTGIESLGSYGFMYCSSLSSVTINSRRVPRLDGSDCFYNTNNCPIYVPTESVNAYKTATNWSTYADRIQAIPNP